MTEERAYPGLPENPPSFENEFDYSVWTPDTRITLCNVPWDSNYRDVVRFEDDAHRESWFSSLRGASVELTGLVYLKYGEPIYLSVPFSIANQFNYVVARNPIQPVPNPTQIGRKPDTFYYFIHEARYVAPNTTELTVQLDAWQTYGSRAELLQCYVSRGHVGIANSNSTIDNLSEYLIEPEGLEHGSEYDIQHQWYIDLQSVDNPPYIVVASTAALTEDWGTLDKPELTTSKGSITDGVGNSCECYAFDGKNFNLFIANLSNYPWVSQCIQSMTVVPQRFCQVSEETVTIKTSTAYKLINNPTENQWRFTFDDYMRFGLPDRYKHLLKFYTFPYSVSELTSYIGGALILRPECVKMQDGNLICEQQSTCVPPMIEGYVYPVGYNGWTTDPIFEHDYATPYGFKVSTSYDSGEFLDMALCFKSFPTLALLNNSYLMGAASTAYMRDYAQQSADWAQQKALYGAQLSYDQSSMGMSAATRQMMAGVNNANALSDIRNQQITWGGIKGGIGAAGGMIGSAASGNIGGTLSSAAQLGLTAADTAANIGWNNQQTALANAYSAEQTSIGNDLSAYNRDTNYAYAQFAAKGDYANAIAGLQAQVSQGKTLQPTASGQLGGDMFAMAKGYYALVLKNKRIKLAFVRQIGEYWLRYGYAINRFMIPPADLKCCEKFTYWQMTMCNLMGDMPEIFRQAIRGIFEAGVTIWSSPDDINRIDLADNEPIERGYYK